jgi:hypothetical protein
LQVGRQNGNAFVLIHPFEWTVGLDVGVTVMSVWHFNPFAE